MAEQYIFTIERLSKAYGKREVLKNIWLAFFPGAKIGVIGGNGAGKSTLLRIMAGVDKDFLGTVRPRRRHHHRLRARRSRASTKTKDVRGNIEEAVAPTRALLHAHEELGDKFGEDLRPDEMDKVHGRVRPGAGRHRRRRRLGPRPPARNRHGRHAPAAGRRHGRPRCPAANAAASPCARSLLQKPDLLLLDEPTNHLDAESVAWLERHLQEYPGTVVAVTHDRYFLDNVAQWILELDRGHGYPVEGQLLRLAGAEAGAAGQVRRSRSRPGARPWPASWSGRRWPRARASPRARPASAPTKSWPPGSTRNARTSWSCRFRPGRTWATWWCGPRTSARATATTC